MNLLSSATPPLDVENARQFELSDELRSLQRQMAALFNHQKRRGGIIDPEAEDSKLLLVTDRTVSGTLVVVKCLYYILSIS
jgi:E3 ubiquitin-protein ligase RNF25